VLLQEFKLNFDEEEKFYASKRESPRARPELDKWVKVMKADADGPQLYKLFDLSRGGMAFIAEMHSEFIKDSDVFIVGFDEFDLDDALVGKVMSIRPLDELELTFKVGVKFSEGQD
jgi:c-di-GMP-binding flagellar brake protein YcgR